MRAASDTLPRNFPTSTRIECARAQRATKIRAHADKIGKTAMKQGVLTQSAPAMGTIQRHDFRAERITLCINGVCGVHVRATK
jgi:hypothetical protein